MWQALETHLAQILKPDNALSSKGLTSLLKALNSNDAINKELAAKMWLAYETRFRNSQVDPTLVAMMLIVAAKSKETNFLDVIDRHTNYL
jgi:hypothetical protein